MPSRSHKCFDYRCTTGPRIEISALRFEDSPLDALEIDLRPAFPHRSCAEFLKLDLGGFEHLHRSPLEGGVAAGSHPKNAAAVQKLATPFALVLRPQLQRSGSHLGVGLVGTIGAPHDSRLTAGRRPRIPRP